MMTVSLLEKCITKAPGQVARSASLQGPLSGTKCLPLGRWAPSNGL